MTPAVVLEDTEALRQEIAQLRSIIDSLQRQIVDVAAVQTANVNQLRAAIYGNPMAVAQYGRNSTEALGLWRSLEMHERTIDAHRC